MTLKSKSLLLLTIPLLVAFVLFDASAAVGGRKGTLLGGWSPIADPKKPQVREIGEFAVTEHNKQAKTELKFESVVRGETQVVAGTNYRLVIGARDGAVLNNYEALVWDKPWERFRNLTSFKRV
uniref:Cystatin domain-containing protein n=1 Tax=Davidia involucrata TaxID=16924 RepID=A0A5B7BHE6_DAVIN